MRRQTSPLQAAGPDYFEELYALFLSDPLAVDESWRAVFRLVGEIGPAGASANGTAVADRLRRDGHLIASLDPLRPDAPPARSAAAAQAFAGVDPGDPAVDGLARAYLDTLAVETGHIDDPAIRRWIADRMERAAMPDAEARRRALLQLVRAETFERFLATKAPTKKRFGAEGAEAVVPLLHRILERAAMLGVDDVVIASMHRGRLNLMVNALHVAPVAMLHAFNGNHPFPLDGDRAADVPYHLGSETVLNLAGRPVRVSLCPNPSHLEAVNPVGAGRVRARQDLAARAGADASRVLGIVLHTDASVIGQGSVSEVVQLAGLQAFGTCGTIHVVVNNQIGFTTDPSEARSSRYCTGPWKAVDSAIVHVNGSDADAVLRAADLAVEFRDAHRRDAVIDLICYRRNGHNELDEPTFTQPLLYKAIDAAVPVAARYGGRLVAEQVCEADPAGEERDRYWQVLQDAYAASEGYRINRSGFPNGRWAPYAGGDEPEAVTGLEEAELRRLLAALARVPDGFTPHPKIARLLGQREEAATCGLSWPVAEALAFASLVSTGTDVRFSGQDVARGAFSHRHYLLHDFETGASLNSVQQLAAPGAHFDVVNSPLSEQAVLGFEYGYSLERPDALVVWEAQFGDFSNCAQVVIDQFIVSAEEKWMQPSGLVLLLPHGLEGQGPEHSSARVERLLQLCAGDNIRVANPSTPANYFHLLRRQVLGKARKPLFVTSPKTLLRLPQAISPAAEFAPGCRFRPVILDPAPQPPRRVLLCSGKIAYALAAERAARGAHDVAIVRLEQIYPFPARELAALLRPFAAAGFVWVQEEPSNMGCWSWLDRRLEAVLRSIGAASPCVGLVARPESPSPAGSFHGNHDADQQALVARAFSEHPSQAREA